ncbi:type III-B CRISPR-associated protein Cas10/Cmr2 [Aeromonas dhakensis]|uniref:type III-B CRISPR-associated protein Cas10/Cmr2 n=1 Tax=Aeromonas dhakensis TaxID=196024 RepID=UPI00288EA35F|nr:type III-B CRISPR-associated protein Cas10/Cmr2 [Aeromonas dhakensis]HDX9007858.1 type III-B CRISPR-associated protein Cas10/Cmr2 [Aeromonas dhakensis]
MSQSHFHFTLGPVQAFVAQARRTRDFWAGSFLLSWLSSVAIKAVETQQGEIAFPKPQPEYMAWLIGQGHSEPPKQGTIPNRFKALSARVEHHFDPMIVCTSVQQAWQGLAEQLWQGDFAPLEAQLGEEHLAATRAIWDRQVQGFWELNWVLSQDATASNLLDRRKNWRSHLPPVEPGVKCMLMEGWQELSGLATPNRQGLNLFWETVRHGPAEGLMVDIREGEALCALAYIKRRFARYFAKLQLPMPGEWTLHGWPLPNSVPSLAYIAAGRWLEKMVTRASASGHRDLLERFLQDLESAQLDVANEQESPLPGIKQLAGRLELDKVATLDGSLWFATQLVQERDESLRLRQRHQADKALLSLNILQSLDSPQGPHKLIGPPHPFYAVLLMDGDSLGSQMSDPAKQAGISAALNRFTKLVPPIVERHNGFLVYAGGDDVLALIGVSDAMACAAALRQCYAECFAEQNRQRQSHIVSTLSGAINIGHIKWPLRALLFDAHHLLDDIAKEATGRDALAIRVWKHDKPHLCWSQPWEVLLSEQGNLLEWLLGHFAQGVTSNNFLFKLQTLIKELRLDQPHGFGEKALANLLWAEYRQSLGTAPKGLALDQRWFEELVRLSTPHVRTLDQHQASIAPHKVLTPDVALLLRFMHEAYLAADHAAVQSALEQTC